jgi:hypothetical protein
VKRAAIVLALVVFGGLAGRLIDLPKISGGFIADEATYVEMAFSVANDFNLKFEPRDLQRFGQLYGRGPDGLFLKRGSRSTETSLDFGKAMAYPVFAAPFAKLGGLGGMFMFNVMLLIGCAWCAAVFAAARIGSAWGLAIGVLFIAASSVPVSALYLMPEVFNFSLVLFAYFLWLYKEVRPHDRGRPGDFLGSAASDVAAAALLGVVTFSKPLYGPLIAPLVLNALWRRDLRRSAVVGGVFVLLVGVWFGATIAVSGEWNYQGGTRKQFYTSFPFDESAHTFDNAPHSIGNVTGGAKGISTDILFPGQPHFWPMIANNAGYFLAGRDSGLIPYYFPGALLLALWLTRIRRADAWQWWTFAVIAGIALVCIFWWPYTWNGGGGPIGNRYYVSVYPLFLFLLPASAGAWTAIAAGLGGVAFLWPVFAHPFGSTKEPWLHPATWPLRVLPVERTMMNDIPARLFPADARWKVPFGDPRNASIYRMDGNAYDGEPFQEGFGFWIAGNAPTEVIIATAWPQTRVRLVVIGRRVDNTFSANFGGSRCRLELKPEVAQTCDLVTADSVWAHGSYFYSLKMSTSAGFLEPPDARNLGVRVVPTFSEK